MFGVPRYFIVASRKNVARSPRDCTIRRWAVSTGFPRSRVCGQGPQRSAGAEPVPAGGAPPRLDGSSRDDVDRGGGVADVDGGGAGGVAVGLGGHRWGEDFHFPGAQQSHAGGVGELVEHQRGAVHQHGGGAGGAGPPQLGWDMFERGYREPAESAAPAAATFLLLMETCVSLFRQAAARPEQPYKPGGAVGWTAHQAMARVLAMLDENPLGLDLLDFLPATLPKASDRRMSLRIAISSTLAASLELARDARASLHQDSDFGPIEVHALWELAPDDQYSREPGEASDDACTPSSSRHPARRRYLGNPP